MQEFPEFLFAWSTHTPSLVAGAVVGLLIGLVARWPRKWKWFAVTLLLTAIAPYTALHTAALGDSGSEHPLLVFAQYFLTAMLVVVNVSFLIRQVWGQTSWHPAR